MIRALPRASGVPAWIRYGLISGAFALAVTLAANLLFLLGTTPPAFIQGTPPPGVVVPTPPPGFTLSPGGGAVSVSLSGSMGTVVRIIGLVVTVGVGMAFATGAAALTGLIGAAMRSRS